MPHKNIETTQLRLPSQDEVCALWEQFGVLPNIRRHSRQVCRVALTMCKWLEEAGCLFNKTLIETGALLHDLAKAYCLDKPGLSHNLEGQRILERAGYPELGEIVAKHVNLPAISYCDEWMLVFYADKRVLGEKVVSVDERFQYIHRVYGQNNSDRLDRIKKDELLAYEVEERLFKLLPDYSPQDLCAIFRERKKDC